MSYALDYAGGRVAAEASADARAAFIRRTYTHLAGAILGFTLLETLLVSLVPPQAFMGMLTAKYAWLLVILAFAAVSWIANQWALSGGSPAKQYLGLGLYVVAEAVIFLPLLYVAANFAAPDVIPKAGIMTLMAFGGLTAVVFVTRKDFSFLSTTLTVGTFLALGVAIVGAFMGFGLGTWFAVAMVTLACGFILYDTSNVLHRYRTDQHVAASLALFASVALLFWYILQIMMSRRD